MDIHGRRLGRILRHSGGARVLVSVTCTGGKWQIVQGLNIDERSRKLMDESAQELTEEFAVAEECLAESA